MFGILMRQGRRLTLSAALSLLAGFLLFGATPLALLPLLGVNGLAISLLSSAPSARRAVECGALAVVSTVLVPVTVLTLGPVLIGFGLLWYALLYGPWTDRLGIRLTLNQSARAQIERPASQLWNALVPGEAHPDDYWNGDLLDFDHDDDDHETVYLRMRTPEGDEEMTVTFIERTPMHRCHYLLERAESHGWDDAEITLEISEISHRLCMVQIKQISRDLPLRHAIGAWLDDGLFNQTRTMASILNDERPAKPQKPAKRGLKLPAMSLPFRSA